MEPKLYDSELKIMEILWREGETTAKEIAAELAKSVGWSKTTTYTVLKKCVEKGAVQRQDPGFHCTALISRQQAQACATRELIDKLYAGSADCLVASLLGNQQLSADEVKKLKQLVEQLDCEV